MLNRRQFLRVVSSSSLGVGGGNARAYFDPVRIVVLGSSNAAGFGSSKYSGDPTHLNGWRSPSTSWVGMLSSALGSGFQILNKSVSGSGFLSSVSRFHRDVSIHSPQYVILCNHPLNDGYSYGEIYRAHLEFIKFCRDIGSIPVLRGAYMDRSMSKKNYVASKSFNFDLDLLGVARIDHFSDFDDGGGAFVSPDRWTVDGLHPNDHGYEKLFRAIDLNIFSPAYSLVNTPIVAESDGEVRIDLGTSSRHGLFGSFTLGLEVSFNRVNGDFCFMQFVFKRGKVCFFMSPRFGRLYVDVYQQSTVRRLGDFYLGSGLKKIIFGFNSVTEISFFWLDGMSRHLLDVGAGFFDDPKFLILYPQSSSINIFKYYLWKVALANDSVSGYFKDQLPVASLVANKSWQSN